MLTNERGEIVTALVVLIVLGLLLGGWYLTNSVPCDPQTQKCIEEQK